MDIYELLKNKILEFGNFLVSVSKNEETINKIKSLMLDMDRFKIAMFITYLNKETINNEFNSYGEFDNDTNEKFNNYIDYFIESRKFL